MTHDLLQTEGEWNAISRELRAYRKAEFAAWDRLDADCVTRYLNGEAGFEEASRIEEAVREFPSIGQMFDIMREITASDLLPLDPTDAFEQIGFVNDPILAFEEYIDHIASIDEKLIDMFGIDDQLLQSWSLHARGSGPESSSRNFSSSFVKDPLFNLVAGETNDTAVYASIPWFTVLSKPISELTWEPRPEVVEWRVQISCPDEFLRWDLVTNQPGISLKPDLFSQIPPGADVIWSVEIAATKEGTEFPLNRNYHVRGVLQMITEGVQSRLEESLGRVAKVKDPHSQRISEIGYLLESRLFFDAETRLIALLSETTDGVTTVLLKRALSGMYGNIQRELSGPRQMGTPEGLWAHVRAKTLLEEAYLRMKSNWPWMHN